MTLKNCLVWALLATMGVMLNATAAPLRHPECSGIERWPTRMAYQQLKNAGMPNSEQIDFSKIKTVRLASKRIGDDEHRQIHQATFTLTDLSVFTVTTSNLASNEECSKSAVGMFVALATFPEQWISP